MNFINWFKRLFGSKNSGKQENNPPVIKEEPPIKLPEVIEIPPVKLPETFPLEDIEPIKDFRFVDSSHHHPEFDVKKYPSKLLINKTSQGTTMVDRTHKERQKLCKENGIIYGGYHFYETKKHWKDQLNHYLKAHGEFAMNPILDFETWEGNQDMSDLRANIENAYQWMIEAEQVTGKRCILYAGYHVLVGLSLPLKFERFIFWVPRYANAIGKLPSPCTEKNLMAWQYTESGAFGGFKGGNDVNLYFGKVNLLGLK